MVRAIEARVRPDAAVFQLPYVPFPETDPVHHLSSNDLFRPYLHSSTLRWILPTTYGRNGDLFARGLSRSAPDQLIPQLAQIGFAGILVSRDGYPDDGAAIEAALRAALPAELVRPPRRDPRRQRRLVRRTVALATTFVAAQTPARLTIDGDLVSARLELTGATPFARVIDVPSGHHVIRFGCDGRPADAPNDPRTMVWLLRDFSFDELAGAQAKLSVDQRAVPSK